MITAGVARVDRLQQWWLALSAIQVEAFGGRHTALRMDDDAPGPWQEALKNSWDVTSSQSLMETVQWLLQGGHSKGFAPLLGRQPYAWDIGRFSWVVRASVSAGFIVQEETAWEMFESITAPMVAAYNSWAGYAEDFLAGRRLWLGDRLADAQTEATHKRYEKAVRRMLDPDNTDSVWQRAEWDTPVPYLRLERPAPMPEPPGGHHAGDFERLQDQVSNRIRHGWGN
jgi:hypothetical protein